MPFLFILVTAFFFISLVGVVALAYKFGQVLLNQAGWMGLSPVLSLALGMLIIFAVTRIPILGGIILVLVWFTGAGVAMATRFGSGESWSLVPLMEESET